MSITHEQLRAAFAGLPPGQAPIDGQITEVVDEPVPEEIRQRLQTGRRPAAVLVPVLTDGAGFLRLMLTQRTAHLRDHAGQISFPGGRVEAHDATPMDTALRETEEEIGLSRERVEILGFLPEYRTGTGFRVTPVVALVTPPFDLQPDPFEVAEIFEVPLSFLLDPANHQQHSLHYRGALRNYFAMPYGDYFIWGATAGMIRSLTERLVVS